MNLEEIVMKLVGRVEPIGDSNVDSERLENLKALGGLIEDLVSHVYWVSRNNAPAHESSRQEAAERAETILKGLADYIPDPHPQ